MTDNTFKPFAHFGTDALHAGQDPDQWNSKAIVAPISLSTTFKQSAPGEHSGYEYSRSGNPSRCVLERCIAALEGGKHGDILEETGTNLFDLSPQTALCFSSGLGATTAITHLLQAGDHIVSMNDLYGGTNRYFSKIASKFNITTTFVDATDVAKLDAVLQPNTKMVWIETPTNPTMQLVDIEAVCKVVKAKSEALIVVDNTFMSAYFQRPLSLGADMAFHSVTKYMNGHTDVVMGAIAVNDDELEGRLRFLQNAIGPVPSPFDCYLVNRGLKTLHLRMQAHMTNGLAVAKFLETSPRVEKVIHPGLPSHPQYELAKRQMRGYSGMVSFYIKGGRAEATIFLQSIKVFCLAESLGGYESLAELPSLMTHASVSEEDRKILGITDSLIRLSVGIEDEDDLVEDIRQALEAAVPNV